MEALAEDLGPSFGRYRIEGAFAVGVKLPPQFYRFSGLFLRYT